MREIFIHTEYITLGQFLQIADLIQTGGQAKFFLQENEVYVNGEKEDRRGRKLYENDHIEVKDHQKFLIRKTT